MKYSEMSMQEKFQRRVMVMLSLIAQSLVGIGFILTNTEIGRIVGISILSAVFLTLMVIFAIGVFAGK